MKKILLILFLFSVSAQAAPQQPSEQQVRAECNRHYTNTIINIMGALSVGMSVEDVKRNISGTPTQVEILFKLIDLLPTDKDKEIRSTFTALINQCVTDNYNKPVKI